MKDTRTVIAMKRLIAILILSTLSALILSACGGGAQLAAAAGPEVLANNLSDRLRMSKRHC